MQSIMVCLFVCCLSTRSHNLKTTQSIFTKFLFMLPMAVAWSFFDGVAMCYVLLGLWTTTFSYHGTNRLESSTSLDLRQLQCLVELIRMRHRRQSLLSATDMPDRALHLLMTQLACKNNELVMRRDLTRHYGVGMYLCRALCLSARIVRCSPVHCM